MQSLTWFSFFFSVFSSAFACLQNMQQLLTHLICVWNNGTWCELLLNQQDCQTAWGTFTTSRDWEQAENKRMGDLTISNVTNALFSHFILTNLKWCHLLHGNYTSLCTSCTTVTYCTKAKSQTWKHMVKNILCTSFSPAPTAFHTNNTNHSL